MIPVLHMVPVAEAYHFPGSTSSKGAALTVHASRLARSIMESTRRAKSALVTVSASFIPGPIKAVRGRQNGPAIGQGDCLGSSWGCSCAPSWGLLGLSAGRGSARQEDRSCSRSESGAGGGAGEVLGPGSGSGSGSGDSKGMEKTILVQGLGSG